MAAELKNTKSSNDILSLSSDLISKYLHRSIPPMALNQNYYNAWLNKMVARAKTRKTYKRHLLCSQCPDFKVISQKCSSYGPLPKLLKSFARLNKMAARAKNRKKKIFKHLLLDQWPDFKMILQKCSSYPPLPKWSFSAE